jgi:hypothetical protein
MSATYAITVDGHLDDHWADRLGGLGIARNDDGTSSPAASPGRSPTRPSCTAS